MISTAARPVRRPTRLKKLAALIAASGLVATSWSGLTMIAPAAPAAATVNFSCTSGQGYGYFVNTNSKTVSIVYTGTDQVVGTVSVGGVPFGVGVTPDGKQVYVAGAGANNGVSVFSTTDFAPRAVPGTFANATGAVSSLDGTKMFVSNIGSNYVSVIDTSTNTVSSTITLPAAPSGWMDIDPTTGLLWVATSTGVTAIDTATNAVTRTITSGFNAHAATVGSGYVYLSRQDNGVIYRYSATTGAAAGVLTLPSASAVHGLAYDPASQTVVATLQNGTVRVINGTAATMSQIRSFTAGGAGSGANGGARTPIISPLGEIYIAASGSNVNAPGALFTIQRPTPADVSTWTISESSTLGNNPDGHTPAFSCAPPLSVNKSMSPAAIPLNGTGRVSLQINNTNFVDVTGVAINDDLPDGMILAADPNTATTCGGTLSTTADRKRVELTGGTIPRTQIGGLTSCVVSFDVVGTSAGTKTNTIDAGDLTADDLPASNTSTSARLTVQAGPSAADDNYSTAADTTVTVSPLSNDTAGLGSDGVAGTFDSASLTLTSPDATDGGKTLVVPDEGTWTVNSDGTVTFDPLPTFTGPVTPVAYTVNDQYGNPTNATMNLTVRETPVANPDSEDTPYNTSVSVSPLANDAAGSGQTLSAASVRLISPETEQPVTSVTVPGEGTYTVDTETGVVTFVPLATFTGEATPVPYTATTTAGDPLSSTITITVGAPAAPTASDDVGSAPFANEVAFTPLANDSAGPAGTAFVPASLRLIDPDTQQPVNTLTVDGEGVWSVDTETGSVTFTPQDGFTGEGTPVAYTVSTNVGDTTGATLTPTIGAPPVAAPDTGAAPYNKPATVAVSANDTPGTDASLDATSVRLRDGAGNPVTSLIVPDKGTWTVDTTTGNVIFTPVTGFSGTVAAPYEITDSDGNTAASTVTVTIAPPPRADDDTTSTAQGTAVDLNVLDNDDGGTNGLDVTSVRLVTPGSGALVTTLTVAGEGTYTVDTTTGIVSFAPLPDFTGTTAPLAYSVADTTGARATAEITVIVDAGEEPTATADAPSTAFNTPVTLNPTANDSTNNAGSTFVAESVRILDPDSGEPVTSLTVAGEGSYTVDQSTGEITFVPLPTFQGTATAISYTAATTFGTSVRSTITPTVGAPNAPTATDDSGSGPYGSPITVAPLDNDNAGDSAVEFVRETLRLVDPATGNSATTVTVAGEGTWTLDVATGIVTFTPQDGFEGAARALDYRVETTAGDNVSATITVTSGTAPRANPNSVTVPSGQTATIDVLENDSAGSGATLDASTVRLRDGAGTPVDTLEVPGQGTWSVNTTTGAISFTPVAGFSGTVTAPYEVTDTNGNVASSTVSVTVAGPPTAQPDTATGPEGTTLSFSPLINDSESDTGADFDPATLLLVDPNTGAAVETVAVSGEGVWTVTTGGTVTFTPVAGFVGTATPISYTVSDTDGVAVSSTLTAIVTPLPPQAGDDVAQGPQGRPITINPLANDTTDIGQLDPTSVRLIGQDGQLVTSLTVAGEGSYSVDPVTGAITFTPEAGFTGSATVRYSVANTEGTRAAADITFTVVPTGGGVIVTPNPGPEGGVVVTTPDGQRLAITGGEMASSAIFAGALLAVVGAVLLIVRRRREPSAE